MTMYQLLETVAIALIPGFMLLDLAWRSRNYEKTRFWRLRSALVTAGIFFFTGYVAVFWSDVFAGLHLFDASVLGPIGGAVVGVLVYEFFHYWYHRAAHRWNWLWRAGHQMHHSAESLDAFGANYLHPFDAAMFTTIKSLVLFPLLGLSPEAGVIAVLFLTFNAMFQHANLKTPHWLGYLIQRPESHAIHHGRGIHRDNYADLPLWDMVFGTFRNPKTAENRPVGFYRGASSRIPEMLIGRDVSEPPQEQVDEIPAVKEAA
jgi:sterol desaturase/sphingolipid hydroxylase (fatty acid hydroxylase superfamily)